MENLQDVMGDNVGDLSDYNNIDDYVNKLKLKFTDLEEKELG